MRTSQFLIGAASSGSGKTTFTLGLLRALKNRGLKVQPFKCGPDYLDTKHHAAAAGQTSYNLDTFMASATHVQEVYARHSQTADICIAEGVMGLFDGYDNMAGSSAEIAGLLHLPVILVVNARSTAYTVAAILYGFKHFHPDIQIAGAVFNFVGSESHYAYLQQACRDAGVEALGYLPKCKDIEIPSRHLGLNIDSEFCFDKFANRIACQVEQTVDIDRLLEACTCVDTPLHTETSVTATGTAKPIRISIAQDEAFNFIYPENIRILEQKGHITYFSPLYDRQLPPSDFVYIPGGYPEFYLSQLSANESMQQSVYHFCQNGGHLLAECGGMMYLGECIRNEQGKPFPMCGYLPLQTTMEEMKLQLGYRKAFIGGQEFHGHEFHYSHMIPAHSGLNNISKVVSAKNKETNTPVFRSGNVIASYIHFYWGDDGILPGIPI